MIIPEYHIHRGRKCRYSISCPCVSLPDPAQSVVEIFHGVFSAVYSTLLFKKVQVSVSFSVGATECAVADVCHCLDLCFEGEVGKIIGPGCGKDEEIIPVMPGIPYEGRHIFPVCGQAAAGRHKVAKIVQTVLEGPPGRHRSHRETAESPMIP